VKESNTLHIKRHAKNMVAVPAATALPLSATWEIASKAAEGLAAASRLEGEDATAAGAEGFLETAGMISKNCGSHTFIIYAALSNSPRIAARTSRH
jgi:hypothetical protein